MLDRFPIDSDIFQLTESYFLLSISLKWRSKSMDVFLNIINSSAFFLTALGAFIGYLSWRSGKDTDILIEKGNERLQKSLDEGNARLQKSLDEGNARLQKSLDEGNVRLQRSIDEGNTRLHSNLAEIERNRENANRRLEALLDSNQKRWEQSDEFNKRMMERILDKVER